MQANGKEAGLKTSLTSLTAKRGCEALFRLFEETQGHVNKHCFLDIEIILIGRTTRHANVLQFRLPDQSY